MIHLHFHLRHHHLLCQQLHHSHPVLVVLLLGFSSFSSSSSSSYSCTSASSLSSCPLLFLVRLLIFIFALIAIISLIAVILSSSRGPPPHLQLYPPCNPHLHQALPPPLAYKLSSSYFCSSLGLPTFRVSPSQVPIALGAENRIEESYVVDYGRHRRNSPTLPKLSQWLLRNLVVTCPET